MNAHLLADMSDYHEGMARALDDKLFFASRIPAEVTVFVDFGCADGALLQALPKARQDADRYGDLKLLGYDHDPVAIREAKAGWPPHMPAAEFSHSLAMLSARLGRYQRMGLKSCLILSSVVHEMLSQEGWDFATVWQIVRDLGCDYVVIRDMAMETEAHYRKPRVEDVSRLTASAVGKEVVTRGITLPHFVRSQAELVEMCLKARYPADLKKESRERYFRMTVEQWVNWVQVGSGYRLRHFDHYSVGYLKADIESRWGVVVKDPTHIKLILQKV